LNGFNNVTNMKQNDLAITIKAGRKLLLAFLFVFVFSGSAYSQWRLYISNDVCMDNTWALTEKQTHDYIANLMAANLDAMNATDKEPWQNKARYTCTVTNEIFFFLDKYPERSSELVSRIREGRIMLSPFLVNTDWGFAGVEGFLRSLYPAKRFAIAYNLPLNHAVHSELPSLPWGVAPLLSGCGIHWINKPFLNYDATFGSLSNPPIFILSGPDSSKINVVMDKYASLHYFYAQGGGVLKITPFNKDTLTIESFWLPHYSSLQYYPMKAILAEGTHSDLSSNSASQVADITKKIIDYNMQAKKSVTMVNATFPMFTDLVDSTQASEPFLPVLKGDFGHSWELWPLALAKYATYLRQGENKLVASEALLASANVDLRTDTILLSIHRRAEWLMAMLADHAWNGFDSTNIRTNSTIRKRFSEELISLTDSITKIGFDLNGLKHVSNTITIYNPTNYKNSSLVEVPLPKPGNEMTVWANQKQLPTQLIIRDGIKSLCFISDTIPGYGFANYRIKSGKIAVSKKEARYNIKINSKTGIDIINSRTSEIETSLQLKYLSDTSYYVSMQEPRLISEGSLASIYQIKGHLLKTEFTIELLVSKSRNDIDFSIALNKVANISKEGIYLICKLPKKSLLHVETTAAVVSPYLAPKGNYLPGADTTRMVMQGFANAEYPNGGGLLLASPDAFCLNPSDTAFVIQLLGNNNNYKEAIKDQNGEISFDFHFSLTPYSGTYSSVQSHTLGFLKQMPLIVANGEIAVSPPRFSILNSSIKVTACKPADPAFGDGTILRLWNTSQHHIICNIQAHDSKKAWITDLLEQNISPLEIRNGLVSIPIQGNGFTAVRFVK
jgi:hypothetical protein